MILFYRFAISFFFLNEKNFNSYPPLSKINFTKRNSFIIFSIRIEMSRIIYDTQELDYRKMRIKQIEILYF